MLNRHITNNELHRGLCRIDRVSDFSKKKKKKEKKRKKALFPCISSCVSNFALVRFLCGIAFTKPLRASPFFFFFFFFSDRQPCRFRSSVRLMPQNQPSGRGLLSSPTACLQDQHLAAMLADVSRHILGRTEGRG